MDLAMTYGCMKRFLRSAEIFCVQMTKLLCCLTSKNMLTADVAITFFQYLFNHGEKQKKTTIT